MRRSAAATAVMLRVSVLLLALLSGVAALTVAALGHTPAVGKVTFRVTVRNA